MKNSDDVAGGLTGLVIATALLIFIAALGLNMLSNQRKMNKTQRVRTTETYESVNERVLGTDWEDVRP